MKLKQLSRQAGMALQMNIYKYESRFEKLLESIELDGKTISENCIGGLLESSNISAELIEFRNSEFVCEMLDTNNLENKIKKLYNKELGTLSLEEAVNISVMRDDLFFKRPEEYTAVNLLNGLCEDYNITKDNDNNFNVECNSVLPHKVVNDLSDKARSLKEHLSDICAGIYPEYSEYITETYVKLNLLNNLVDSLLA